MGYNWKDQWDWKRIRNLKNNQYEKLLFDMRVAMHNIDSSYKCREEQRKAVDKIQRKLFPYQIRMVNKIHKELIKKEIFEPANTKKKRDKWHFRHERKNKNSKRTYVVKRKMINGKRVKEYQGT